MQNTFREKAVIIADASSEIGKALALQLTDKGARIALAARNSQHLDAFLGNAEKEEVEP